MCSFASDLPLAASLLQVVVGVQVSSIKQFLAVSVNLLNSFVNC